MQPANRTSEPIIIQNPSREGFVAKIEELLLNPPDWVSHYVQQVRKTLDDIPSDLSDNYGKNYSFNGVRLEYEFTKKQYKVTLKDESDAFLSQKFPEGGHVVYQGRLTSESVSQFPSSLQPQAAKLAQSDFPYVTTITDNTVTIGGSYSSTGKVIKLKLSDLLKDYNDKKN